MPDLEHAGWVTNLIAAGRLQPGEYVLIIVDEPLVACGSELEAAVQDAGGRGSSSSGQAIAHWPRCRPRSPKRRRVSTSACSCRRSHARTRRERGSSCSEP